MTSHVFQVGVYHMTTGGFRNGLDRAGWEKDVAVASQKVMDGIKDKRYVMCAQVQAVSLEDALTLTQNLTEEGWAAGEAVVFAAQHRDGENRQRSSMVGDLFLFNGDAYVVAAIGFQKLHGCVAREISDMGFDGRTGTAFDDR